MYDTGTNCILQVRCTIEASAADIKSGVRCRYQEHTTGQGYDTGTNCILQVRGTIHASTDLRSGVRYRHQSGLQVRCTIQASGTYYRCRLQASGADYRCTIQVPAADYRCTIQVTTAD